MPSNQALLAKADIVIGDLVTNGGVLNPEQANTFVRRLISAPSIINVARTVEMNANQRNINKIQFATRIMRAGVSGTGLSSSDRSQPTTTQIQLNTNEVIAEVRLPYDVIEDNIERGNLGQNMDGTGSQGTPAGGGLVATILTLIAERAALDLEELAIRGDTTSTDDYLALTDGYLEAVSDGGNTVDLGGATITKDMFKKGLLTLPTQYKRQLSGMWHMIAKNNEVEYRDTLADRATALGDQNIQARNAVFGFGVPILGVDLMPIDKGLLSNPLNFLFGIQRNILMEFDKDISARVWKVVLTARVDFQVEEDEAAVQYLNIATPA